jgi:hypothetical protein
MWFDNGGMYCGGMYGYDEDGYGGYGGGDRFGRSAPASAAALRREESAKASFSAAKASFEEETLSTLTSGEKHVIPLLQPNVHLTSHCWSTFKQWVKSNNEGWDVKRREANPAEKKASGEKRQGKVYFVDVVYKVPGKAPSKSKKKKVAPAPAAAEDSKMPPAKKQKLDDVTNATTS